MTLRVLSWILWLVALAVAGSFSFEMALGVMIGALLVVLLMWAHEDQEIAPLIRPQRPKGDHSYPPLPRPSPTTRPRIVLEGPE